MNNDSFNSIIQLVNKKSPLQRKKIEKYLSIQDESFFQSAEKFAKDYSSYLESQNIPLEDAVDAYLKMCNDMIKSQVFFMKTGTYPVKSADDAFDIVYNDEKRMKSFMIGLAFSQFLWLSHYKIYQFFLENIIKEKGNVNNYLEIGPGHGLFIKDAYEILGKKVNYFAIDISKTSIDITKSILDFLEKNNKIKSVVMNILDYTTNEKYDFISMGEVIEHIDNPEILLRKLRELLSNNGVGFISTCVNCPTIDHVYHFKSVDEIRNMLYNNGLLIYDEKVLPIEDISMAEIVNRKITINYCAIVRRLI